MRLLLIFVALLSWPAIGRADTVFRVPVVATVRAIETGQVPEAITRVSLWSSSASVFNLGSSTGWYRYLDFLGGGKSLGQVPHCSPGTVHAVPPGVGQYLSPCVSTPLDGSGVGFLLVETSVDVGVHASVSHLEEICNCASLDCTPIPQGRSHLPVFTSVFPAGSAVVVGEIDLGRVAIPPACAPASERYPRRVNVTLLNEGYGPGSFLLRVIPYRGGSAPLLEQSVVVPARDVLQINRLALDLDQIAAVVGTVGPDGGVRVWVEVSSDQPFLAYASTVFDGGAPGSMPFEIYPPLALPSYRGPHREAAPARGADAHGGRTAVPAGARPE